jgi:hypothetical protein
MTCRVTSFAAVAVHGKGNEVTRETQSEVLCVAAAGCGRRGGAWITEFGLAVRCILARVASGPLISFSSFEHTEPL